MITNEISKLRHEIKTVNLRLKQIGNKRKAKNKAVKA